MPGELPHARRLALLEEAFLTLPERTIARLERFFARVDAPGARRPRARAA